MVGWSNQFPRLASGIRMRCATGVWKILRCLCLCGLSGSASGGQPAFSRVFGDHMVLPMNREVPVWGQADPESGVTLEFGGRKITGKAGTDGKWRIVLPSMPASAEGGVLTVIGRGGSASIRDVLVGRVWLCSGQSNMDFPLSRAVGGKEEAAVAGRFQAIRLCNWTGAPTDSRLYQEAELSRLTPEKHFRGTWATAESAAGISAIAWWAARMVHEETKLPIGIVENAVGGSPMEAWLPVETLRSGKDYADMLESGWLDCPRMSPWARSRVRQNLGRHLDGNHPFRPGFLFESGVRPWCGFPFDAVLWYQGETNAEIDDEAWHRGMLMDLVGGWRQALGNKELPFVMIQLPRIGGNDPLRKYWPGFRKAQAAVASTVPGVKLVQTVDLGWDSPDVHPPDKKPVAGRAAALLK